MTQSIKSNFSKQQLAPNPNYSHFQSVMDPNPFNENNTNPWYAEPPYVSPLHEALLPFYHPENTYTPVPPLMHQYNDTPISANWNNPGYVPETTAQAPVVNYPDNYLMSNFIVETKTPANSEQSFGAGKQDSSKQIFQCEKCPAKFYSRQAFGGHMSSHSKQARKYGNVSQEMMAKANNSKHAAASISAGMNEASASATSKKRGRKKEKNVVTDEPNAKKQV